MIKNYIAFDLETTGLNVETDEIIEIGALKVRDGKVYDRFIEFVKPTKPIGAITTGITGITNEMVSGARNTETIIREFLQFCEKDILIGHNIMFDYKFIKMYARKLGLSFDKKGIDTLGISRKVHKDMSSKSLESLCTYYRIENKAAHRAYHDALATAKLYHILAHEYEQTDEALFAPKQLQYRPKKVQPCTKKQILYLYALCEQYHIAIPQEVEKFTRSEMSREIDKIIASYGKL